VDWDGVVRGGASAVLRQAGSYSGTHAFLATVLRQAGGRHSWLGTPQSGRQLRARAAAAPGPPVPSGHLAGGAAYLRLPRLPGGPRLARRYALAGGELVTTLTAAQPAGWVVDLRDNTGGNMWPMLAAAAALLPEGVLGYFVLRDGRRLAWSLDGGRVRLDGKPRVRARGPRSRAGLGPVAVLTSGRTASAAEAVAVAFHGLDRSCLIGQPTAGFTSGNETHVLRDGTRLHITTSYYADRGAHIFTGPIPVSQHITGRGPVLDPAAALAGTSARGSLAGQAGQAGALGGCCSAVRLRVEFARREILQRRLLQPGPPADQRLRLAGRSPTRRS
jgi:carboxyl-terminal processing protease